MEIFYIADLSGRGAKLKTDSKNKKTLEGFGIQFKTFPPKNINICNLFPPVYNICFCVAERREMSEDCYI